MFRVGDGYGVPPMGSCPSIRNMEPDYNGNSAAESVTLLPSAINGASLRAKRQSMNGDTKFGSVQDLPRTGGWVGNWASYGSSRR
jgi:hypothetical protein